MTETNRLYKNRDKNYIKKGLLMKRSKWIYYTKERKKADSISEGEIKII